jgi:hypothetical protein
MTQAQRENPQMLKTFALGEPQFFTSGQITKDANTMKTLTLAALAVIAAAGLSVSAQAQQSPRLYAPDGTYLGNLNTNRFDPNSVSNPYGQYGSPYSPNSINNPYGQYGNPYSPNSVRNPYAN